MQCCDGVADEWVSEYEYVIRIFLNIPQLSPLYIYHPRHKCTNTKSPTVAAIMMEDPQTGQRYLQVKHFISRGIPSSIMTFVVVISVGYGLMRIVGF